MAAFNFIRCKRLVFAAVAVSLVAGCGGKDGTPELGNVRGRVTLDGEPLVEASVRFQPTEGGRPASATTDADGYYELQYTTTAHGALLGPHVVRISTGQEGYDDGDEVQPAIPEKVPVQYNRDALDNPEMTVEITAGRNEINFPLVSDGEIAQPSNGEELARRGG